MLHVDITLKGFNSVTRSDDTLAGCLAFGETTGRCYRQATGGIVRIRVYLRPSVKLNDEG